MDENKTLYETIEKQEELLQFTAFTADTALQIGLKLIDRSKAANEAIAITIIRNGFELFHHAMEGTTPDNNNWIAGKNRLVNRFHKSSLTMAKKIRSGAYPKDSSLDSFVAGGAFPIRIKGSGLVGTITVSGLDEKDDHGWIVLELKELLNVPECPTL